MYTRIPLGHNRNTCAPKAVLQRAYDVPTGFTPPPAKGNRKQGTATIFYYYTPTPEKGVGDPRVKGTRIVNEQLRTQMFVG
jgi:hypothetical protein